MKTDEVLLTVSSAARLAKKSEASIRAAERKGFLPAIRTETGTRLFRAADVMAFVKRQMEIGKQEAATQ